MKLYTEEQVRDMLNTFILFTGNEDANDYIEHMTPIELPSDEWIEKEARLLKTVSNVSIIHSREYIYWKEGAKWVIDKIKNQQQ